MISASQPCHLSAGLIDGKHYGIPCVEGDHLSDYMMNSGKLSALSSSNAVHVFPLLSVA